MWPGSCDLDWVAGPACRARQMVQRWRGDRQRLSPQHPRHGSPGRGGHPAQRPDQGRYHQYPRPLGAWRTRLAEGRRPRRDVVVALRAEEGAGGRWGARWLVENHLAEFEGVTEAIGEVGGFSVTIGGKRLCLLQTAEKGMAWMRLTARGT